MTPMKMPELLSCAAFGKIISNNKIEDVILVYGFRFEFLLYNSATSKQNHAGFMLPI